MMRIKEVKRDYITIQVSEKLVRQDYDLVVPELERLMVVNHGRLNVLLELDNFKGWDPQALGREVRFDIKHRHDSGKVAIVADESLEQLGKQLAKPIFSGDLRFFPKKAAQRAQQWLQEGLAAIS